MKLITINHAAKTERGMTVGEIADFLSAVRNQYAPLANDYIVKAEITGDSTILSLETTLAISEN